MIRELIVGKLKPSCVDDYINAHNHIWTELEEEYRKYGMSQISCFLHDRQLFVYLEYEEKFLLNKENLKVDPKWQTYMSLLVEAQDNELRPKEVYHFDGY